MAFKFPFTNYHELNLTWVLEQLKKLFEESTENVETIESYENRLSAVETELPVVADNAQQAVNTANSAGTLAQTAKSSADHAEGLAYESSVEVYFLSNRINLVESSQEGIQQQFSALEATVQNFDGRITQAEDNASEALQETQSFNNRVNAAINTANNAANTATIAQGIAVNANQNAAGALDKIGNLEDLTTRAKNNLVAAINEAAQSGGGGSGGAVNDVQVDGQSVVVNGVANIPVATLSNPGVVYPYTNRGITIDALGRLSTDRASLASIKAGSANYAVMVPSNQHMAVFYGLAKSAGDTTQKDSANAVGSYTEDAKSAIHTMLNAPVTVEGTTPTIAAKDGITYICGEVASLDITLPASGIFDIIFQSGTTPTVLTVTGVTWLNGFDPSTLEASVTYEINILNGLGVAAWT